MTRRTYREHRSAEYQRLRRRLLGLPCWRCGKPATSADHVPPLAEWYRTHAEPWQGELRPSCGPCQSVDGGPFRPVTIPRIESGASKCVH